MKNKCIILAICWALALLAGCVSPQQSELLTYKTLAATAEAANAAMNTYGELYRAGAVSTQDQERIDSVHEDFRTRFDLAVQAARYDYAAATPIELSLFLSTLIMEIEALK